ncbi:hypothetical protein [Rufibacter tibetensis]|uniref:Uncharacterized protein n=1 Tax=Rufibacter tibetensis TaxID=512763 RepID=A0A0N7HWT1_9BACT|nr:hypothetical protein [Rufibacter tibetensis]ALJ00113.1 hypothetical protein DC20_15460 [Rufibacter tibetensis]
MKKKIPLETVLYIIQKADLVACSDAVDFINSLDFYQYTQDELKNISDTLGERLTTLIRLELRPGTRAQS